MRRKIKHIQQPEDSLLCGQTCVAMILGITLSEAVHKIGHKKGTWAKELINVLKKKFKKNIRSKRIKNAKKNKLPDTAIIKVIWRPNMLLKAKGHWVLKYKNKIHDPAFSTELGWRKWKNEIKYRGRIVSYIELE